MRPLGPAPNLVKHQFSPRHEALLSVIVEARQAARLTQRQLSLKLKRGRSFMYRIESGQRTLDYLEGIDLAEALGLDPFDLLDRVLSHGKRKEEPPPIVVTAKKRPKKKNSGRRAVK